MAAKSKPLETLTAGDLGVAPVGWAGAGQSIVDVAQAPPREAGEVVVDEGEAHLKVVEFLKSLKIV